MRAAATHPDDNSGERFPYNLPIWRSSYTVVSQSGARRAEIAHAGEHSMGNPMLGSLHISDGLLLQRCNPSFVWSDCSRYLAFPQLQNFMGTMFGMRMLVIDCERRLIWISKRYRWWLHPDVA